MDWECPEARVYVNIPKSEKALKSETLLISSISDK
jgi:hypothetical protein